MIRFIWQQDRLPKKFPNEVQNQSEGLPIAVRSTNRQKVQRLTQRMEYGITTHAYFFQAHKFAGCLLIYHTGHGEPRSAEIKDSLLRPALDGGCDLLLAAMPFMHENPQPVVQTRFGPLLLRDHDSLALFATEQFNPLKLFMEPVLAALNYAIEVRGSYRGIYMVGLSGGGGPRRFMRQ